MISVLEFARPSGGMLFGPGMCGGTVRAGLGRRQDNAGPDQEKADIRRRLYFIN